MLFSELVMLEAGYPGTTYWLSQSLRRRGDKRDWRVQRNLSRVGGLDKWYIEHRSQGLYFSGPTEDGHVTTCLAELGCWLTEFTPITPRGNDDHERSREETVD